MNKNKLGAKDLITTAIFSVVFSLIVFFCAMTIGMLPLVYPFLVAIGMIPCGIVWVYMRVKVPKAFGILIQCTVLSLFLFVLGSGWFIAAGVFVGGVLAELISATGKYKNFKLNTLGYAAFGVSFNIGGFAIILLARDYYYNHAISAGMDTKYMDTLVGFMSWGVMLLTTVLTIITAFIGMFLGKIMLKKHFIKAGIL